jgi:hypothetical protein
LFTGGLEAALLKQWHITEMIKLRTKRMYFAYDTPEDCEPLYEAGKLLRVNGITLNSRIPNTYCLIGYPKDTFDAAEKRLTECLDFGFTPYAMLYRDKAGERDPDWGRFQRSWARPTIIYMKHRDRFTQPTPAQI